MKKSFFSFVAFTEAFFLGQIAFAKHVPPPDYDPTTTEAIHKEVSTRVNDLAESIDFFFSEKRALDKQNRSTFIISQTQEVPQSGIPPTKTSVSLNLRLVTLEKMGQEVGEAFLGIEDQEEYQKDPRHYPDVTPNEKKSPLPKQKKEVKKAPSYPWRVTLDQLVMGKIPPGYIAKLRTTKDFETFGLISHFQHEFGYDTDNIWTTNISFITDRQLNTKWLARWANEANWFLDRYTAGSSHGPTFVHNITPRIYMSYNLRLNTTLWDRVLFTNSYSLNVIFRQDIYGGWIFFNVEPSLTWPRDRDYQRVWNLLLRAEAIFG
ncbi:MAG: hypothetical protein AB7F59_12080 [Bdellovibrionales bacterium]